MTYLGLAGGGLDDAPFRFGGPRVAFRRPYSQRDGHYVVALGGTETHGKHVARPYPDLLEDHLGVPVANFGAVNAGIDVFCLEGAVLEACSGARAVVLQAMGAQNSSNRFYRVHPRRNDRFLGASPELRALYPDIDFTEFAFTRHLVQSLVETGPERFAPVLDELRSNWLSRMTGFLDAVAAPVVLLWMAERQPQDPCALHRPSDPLFVTAEMIDAIRSRLAGVVVATSPRACGTGAPYRAWGDRGGPATAIAVPGPAIHEETAAAVADRLRLFV